MNLREVALLQSGASSCKKKVLHLVWVFHDQTISAASGCSLRSHPSQPILVPSLLFQLARATAACSNPISLSREMACSLVRDFAFSRSCSKAVVARFRRYFCAVERRSVSTLLLASKSVSSERYFLEFLLAFLQRLFASLQRLFLFLHFVFAFLESLLICVESALSLL